MATIPSNQKILTSAPEVNTTYGGPASLQALNTWYTMEDIANTIKPYKVFTALLKQSGGDDWQDILSGDLQIGVTYQIFFGDEGSGWDFTNVGAPNNDIGTYFIATGTTPNSWGSGVSLLYNTGAPVVVTVLENTIGNIWFTYGGSIGLGLINSLGLFTENKSAIFGIAGAIGDDLIFSGYMDNNSINSFRTLSSDGTTVGNYGSTIEIRVYN